MFTAAFALSLLAFVIGVASLVVALATRRVAPGWAARLTWVGERVARAGGLALAVALVLYLVLLLVAVVRGL